MQPMTNDTWRSRRADLRRFVSRRVSDRHEAEDIVQDVLVRLARSLGLTHEALYRTLATMEREGVIQREEGQVLRLARCPTGRMTEIIRRRGVLASSCAARWSQHTPNAWTFASTRGS